MHPSFCKWKYMYQISNNISSYSLTEKNELQKKYNVDVQWKYKQRESL